MAETQGEVERLAVDGRARLLARAPAFAEPFSAKALHRVRVDAPVLAELVLFDVWRGQYAEARRWAEVGAKGFTALLGECAAAGTKFPAWSPTIIRERGPCGGQFAYGCRNLPQFACLASHGPSQGAPAKTVTSALHFNEGRARALLNVAATRSESDARWFPRLEAIRATYFHLLHPAQALGQRDLASKWTAEHNELLTLFRDEKVGNDVEAMAAKGHLAVDSFQDLNESDPPLYAEILNRLWAVTGLLVVESYQALIDRDRPRFEQLMSRLWAIRLAPAAEQAWYPLFELLPLTVHAIEVLGIEEPHSMHPRFIGLGGNRYWAK